MYDHMSFLIFLILSIIKRIPDRYLKLLHFSVPKLLGTDTFNFFIKIGLKTRTEPEQLFYFWRTSTGSPEPIPINSKGSSP